MADNQPLQGPLPTDSLAAPAEREFLHTVIIPASHSIPTLRSSASLTPLVCDERAISRLLETLLSRAGLSIGEASRRMGVTTNTIRQYLRGRRNKPSLIWFIRLAELCGAKVVIEFPGKK